MVCDGLRNGNVALRDFWRYSPEGNAWDRVRGGGDCPPCLQACSMVEYAGVIYVFGGELSFCNDQETPLWLFHIADTR